MSNRNQPDHTLYCTEQAMQHDRERFLSAMLAPVEMRRALVALIAWNLEIAKIGEIASEEMIGLIRYQWWRDALDEIYSGQTIRQHAVVLELAEAIAVFSLPKEPFLQIIAARETDLDAAPFPALDALESYAEQTGGHFLRLWLHVLGARGQHAETATQHIGTAWALVGGIRACYHLAHHGKVRLPQDALEKAGISASSLLQDGFSPAVHQAVEAVAALADSHLQAARLLQDILSQEAVAPNEVSSPDAPPATQLSVAFPALSLAVQVEDFLARLEKSGYDPAHPRMQQGRAWRAAKLWWANLRKCY